MYPSENISVKVQRNGDLVKQTAAATQCKSIC